MTGDILARLQAAQSDAEREWVVMEWSLANLEPEVREAVWAAAIPHWFDLGYLAALLDRSVEETRPIYQRLITLSYVEAFPGRGYNVHERTRNLLLERLWQENQQHFRILSDHAADFCLGQDQEVITWRVEAVYHLFVVKPERAVELFRAISWVWFDDYAYAKLDVLTRTICEHVEEGRVSTPSGYYVLSWRGMVGLYFAGMSQVSDLASSLESKSTELSEPTDLAPDLMADVHFHIGSLLVLSKETEAARASFVRALNMYREIDDSSGEARCLSRLASMQWSTADFDESLADYQSAMMIYRSLGNRIAESQCLAGAGSALVMLGRYDEAIEYYNQVLGNLQPHDAKWYALESKIGLFAAGVTRPVERAGSDFLSNSDVALEVFSFKAEFEGHRVWRDDQSMLIARHTVLLARAAIETFKRLIEFMPESSHARSGEVLPVAERIKEMLARFDIPVVNDTISEIEALELLVSRKFAKSSDSFEIST